MKIVTIVGARPQFIKAAAVSRQVQTLQNQSVDIQEVIIHTGQHYDHNMSSLFFEELSIPEPDYNLAIKSGSHGEMTGQMIQAIEPVLLQENPDWVLLYGDTNSTLAGAITASKLGIPLCHVEAGLRSFNMSMPEEINRILTDKVSTLLLCPTKQAMDNLSAEGQSKGVHDIGDVMLDVSLFYRDVADKNISLDPWQLTTKEYVLTTIHRQENTDSEQHLTEILSALNKIAQDTKVILPLHPRTKKKIIEFGLNNLLRDIRVIEPVSYLEMIKLQMHSCCILTDSGGVQKEAYFLKVPCITMREETEWVETLASGANRLVGASFEKIIQGWQFVKDAPSLQYVNYYGDGSASSKALELMMK